MDKGLVYSGVFALWLGNIVWVWAVGKIGVRTAIYQYLLPVFSLIFAYILLENLVLGQVLGTICILVGMILSENKHCELFLY